MKKFTGTLYVILYLWSLSLVFKAIDVKQDLAPQEYNFFKENFEMPPWTYNVSIPGNTVTDYPGGLSKWVQSIRYPT